MVVLMAVPELLAWESVRVKSLLWVYLGPAQHLPLPLPKENILMAMVYQKRDEEGGKVTMLSREGGETTLTKESAS
jgi:hypothetical protein